MEEMLNEPSSTPRYNEFSLDEAECRQLLEVVRDLDARSCLEFGAGASTCYLTRVLGLSNVWSYETFGPTLRALDHCQMNRRDLTSAYTRKEYIEDCELFGRTRFDFAFVDGPPAHAPALLYQGRYARWHSVVCAKMFTDSILMHDTRRRGEQATIDALLEGWRRREYESPKGLTLLSRRPLPL